MAEALDHRRFDPVSVVIPLYNEAESIECLLEALSGQTLLPDEVICVDAGSQDETAERVRRFRGRHPMRLVRERRLNPGEARNVGVEVASHAWIAFIDGGTLPRSSWLERLTAAARHGTDVVFGSYEPAADTFFRRCAALAYVPPKAPEGVRGPFIASSLLSRDAIEIVGGFPPQRASEDLEFIDRVRASRLHVSYAPEAVVIWQTAPDVRSTFRRFALYSRANLEAGRGGDWHRRLALQTGLVIAAVLLVGLAGAGPWGLGLFPVWYLARSAKQALAKSESFSFPVWRPHLLVGTAAMLVVVDTATWFGAARWLRTRSRPER
jgi:glycosyltransferase involved in cell wall biosynthesis